MGRRLRRVFARARCVVLLSSAAFCAHSGCKGNLASRLANVKARDENTFSGTSGDGLLQDYFHFAGLLVRAQNSRYQAAVVVGDGVESETDFRFDRMKRQNQTVRNSATVARMIRKIFAH
jgi:hypothetical protein